MCESENIYKNNTEKQYPNNLLCKAFGRDFATIYLSKEQMAGLNQVIESLSERAKSLITYRYKNGMTWSQIASIFGITIQSVYNINAKVMLALQRPENEIKIKIGISAILPMDKDSLKILGLTPRAYGVLQKNGLKNISDITSVQQLKLLRNLGPGLLKEIMEKLENQGIALS